MLIQVNKKGRLVIRKFFMANHVSCRQVCEDTRIESVCSTMAAEMSPEFIIEKRFCVWGKEMKCVLKPDEYDLLRW